MITVIEGDALEVVPTLGYIYNVTVFDPPAELSFEQCVQSLKQCWKKSDIILFYGVNPGRIIERISAANLAVLGMTPIINYNGKVMGYVVHAGKGEWSPIMSTPMATYFAGDKGTPTHPTAKDKIWYDVVQDYARYGLTSRHFRVLDPFAGEGELGLLCKERGWSYTGIELDPTHFVTLQKKLG